MQEQFVRTQLILGQAGMERLYRSRVAVFGAGGVGGHVIEALARSGVGALDIIDKDTVSVSNLNRQIIATRKTVGRPKTEVARERILEINPDLKVSVRQEFYLPDTADSFDLSVYDYIVDAIDTVTGKLTLIERAIAAGTPIISCMGTGNKMDPTALTVTDISKTTMCPLARIMRKELRRRGIHHLKVVYSEEEAIKPDPELVKQCLQEDPDKRQIPGSNAFVPAAAGLILAAEVIKELSGFSAR